MSLKIKSKQKNRKNITFSRLLLLMSGDISLNPGPFNSRQSINNNEWYVFKTRGLHFVHIVVTRLLPKIDKLRDIAKKSNATILTVMILTLHE